MSADDASARVVALRVLLRVDGDGAWADRALVAALTRADLDARDRAFAVHLASAAIKGRRLLDRAILDLAERDPTDLDSEVRAVLHLGAAQLLLLDRVPPHAAVSTSVDLLRRRGRRVAGLANAVLRRIAEGGEEWRRSLPDATATEAAVVRSYPDWIAEVWSDAFGLEAAKALMDRGNEPAEIALRINALRPGADERVEAELGSLGAALERDPATPSARVVRGAVDLASTRAFAAGDLVPMSRSAQRIAPFASIEPGQRVLDACASPGGKAGHIAALLGGGAGLVCVERNPGRARLLADNLERQGVHDSTLIVDDARTLPSEERGFDRIVVDAPCSGLGTVASRADLRWRPTPRDVDRLVAIQGELIEALLPRLANGGILVFAVCTLGTPEMDVADAFGVEERLLLRPDQGAGEGFAAARITKAA